MTRTDRLPVRRLTIVVVVILLITAVGVSAFAARNVASAACANGQKFRHMEIGKANGCMEFWLNRYQGLIGGILALVGAGLTVWVVRQQIAAQRESAARTARVIAITSLRAFFDDAEAKHYESGNPEEFHDSHTFELPHLTVTERPEALAALGPKESESLFAFSMAIEDARRKFAGQVEFEGQLNEYEYRDDLGEFTMRAARLINKLNERVNWQPFRVDPQLVENIKRAKANYASRTAR